MSDKPTRKRTSTLASLGIKANTLPSASPAPQRPTTVRPSPTAAPKSQKTPNGSTSSSSSAGSTRMRSRANTMTSGPSPVSPTPSQRRSIVPTSSVSRQSSSPLARRSSHMGTTGAPKRLSSPTGMDPLAEKALVEKIAELEAQLKEKIKALKERDDALLEKDDALKEKDDVLKEKDNALKEKDDALKEREEALEEKEGALQESLAKVESLEKDERLLSSSTLLIPCTVNEERKQGISRTDLFETGQDSREVKDVETITKAAMDKLLEDQEDQLRAELTSLRADHEQHIKQLKEDNALAVERLEQQHKLQLQTNADEHASAQHAMEQQIKELLDSRDSIHLRKLEQQLAEAQKTLTEHEGKAKEVNQALEERLRAEIRQLQNGSDDAAQDWLQKHRANQDEITRLIESHQQLEEAHAKELKDTEDQHQQEINHLLSEQKTQEEKMEGQAQEIESLLLQVESLQNAVEAARERTSRRKPGDTDVATVPLHNIHDGCEKKMQEQLDEIAELKTTLHRLEKNKQQRPVSLLPNANNDRLIEMAHQHQKELQILHEQYQQAMDTKDKELESYSYNVKTIRLSRQRELDELRSKVDRLERQTKQLEREGHNREEENDQLIRLVNQLQGEIHKGSAKS